jgi:hypothetical protein
MQMSRLTRTLTAGALLAAATITGGQVIRTTRAEAVTLAADPDRNSTTVTGWIWYHSQTPSQVTSRLGSGYRLTDLEVMSVDGSGVPTLSMVAVSNSGIYARANWGWSTGLTSAQVSSTLGTTNRLIDLERYLTPSGTRYAIVYVPNSGVQQKVGGYRLNQTSAQLQSFVQANAARLIDLDSFLSGQTRYYNAIWIKNTGVDTATTTNHYGKTIDAILQSNQRMLTVERRSDGLYDAITVAGGGYWHYYNVTQSQASALLSQLGARISRLEPRGGGTFDVILLDNLSAESKRVRNLALGKMGPYNWGFYTKRIGGSEVASLQKDTVFEPASAIKVLHHLMEMRRVAAGTDSLSTRMPWYHNTTTSSDDPNNCPDYTEGTANTVRTSVRQALYGMMWDSDNRLTRGFTLRHGLANLNSYADTLGMTRTELRQDRIGCAWANGLKNDTTLRDLGTLYEKVSNGTALAAAQKANFIDLMINVKNPGFLSAVIDSEGSSLGKSAAVVAAFKQEVLYYAKGGSYGICPTTCNPPIIDIGTEAGVVSFPLRAGGSNDYVFGKFMQGQVNCSFPPPGSAPCATTKTAQDALNVVRAEMFRSAIRTALSSW